MYAINFATLIIMPYHPLIFNIFFLLFNFSSPNYLKKKKQNKTKQNLKLFFSLLVHDYCYTSSNFSSPILLLYLSTTLFFTITLPSSFLLFYILTFLLSILFCINLISFPPFNLYFSHTKNVNTLSLGGFLFFLIALIQVD